MVSMFETRFLNFGGIAQLARASALQAEGHRFDSDYLHQNILRCVAVVASQSHKLKGRWFESNHSQQSQQRL